MRGMRCNAPARAPGGTLSMWARTPRASRSLCGRGPRERRGTGTIPLPISQMRSPAPKTGRTGGGGLSADPGLRNRAGRMGGNSLGVGPPLNAVSMGDLRQRFATWKKVQPQLAGTHARLSIHVLGILNHVMGKHRPNRDSVTPNSLLRAIELWYLMPALLHSPDGRIKRRQRFALVERGHSACLLYTSPSPRDRG